MKAVFIGEAWGETEEQTRHPFVGAAGQELYRMLADSNWLPSTLPYKFISGWSMIKKWAETDITLLNTFNSRPPANAIETYYASLKDELPVDESLGPRRFGSAKKFVLTEHAGYVLALHEALRDLRPNLIIPMGATAMWALGLPEKISTLRGNIIQTAFGKAIPIYHPAAVIRNWSLRSITLIDLLKAHRESQSPDLTTTRREIHIPESVKDIYDFFNQNPPPGLLSIDIETEKQSQISEFGFAPTQEKAMWIPILLRDPTYRSVWSIEDEIEVWKAIRHICMSPYPKIGQNLKYDVYWLARKMHIPINNWQHDTMLQAHVWQPEFQKGLGFLGSIFLDEVSWKGLRRDTKGEE